MPVQIVSKGDFKKTFKFFEAMKTKKYVKVLDQYAKEGVSALSSATPKLSGKTASSWDYKIETGSDSVSIVWSNSNVNKGVNIAVILQYGHGTRNGGYVVGIDYINPALRPVFDRIADKAWMEVTNA